MKKKRTFIVEITDTQSYSWQGSVEWVQGHKKQAFRSALELLRLLDSAVADEKTDWGKGPSEEGE